MLWGCYVPFPPKSFCCKEAQTSGWGSFCSSHQALQREMGEHEINRFLTHLAVNVSASTQNQALCAIVFLYKHVLKKELGDFGNFVWAKKPKKLPVVFTKDEVKAVLS